MAIAHEPVGTGGVDLPVAAGRDGICRFISLPVVVWSPAHLASPPRVMRILRHLQFLYSGYKATKVQEPSRDS